MHDCCPKALAGFIEGLISRRVLQLPESALRRAGSDVSDGDRDANVRRLGGENPGAVGDEDVAQVGPSRGMTRLVKWTRWRSEVSGCDRPSSSFPSQKAARVVLQTRVFIS